MKNKLKPADLDIVYRCWRKEKHVGGSYRLVHNGTHYGVQYYPNLFGKIITVLLFPVYVVMDGWKDACDTVKDIVTENFTYTFWIMDKNQAEYCAKIYKG